MNSAKTHFIKKESKGDPADSEKSQMLPITNIWSKQSYYYK